MITTTDNPYNPVDNFNEWYSYDRKMNYDTLEKTHRIYANFGDDNDWDENTKDALYYEAMLELIDIDTTVDRYIIDMAS